MVQHWCGNRVRAPWIAHVQRDMNSAADAACKTAMLMRVGGVRCLGLGVHLLGPTYIVTETRTIWDPHCLGKRTIWDPPIWDQGPFGPMANFSHLDTSSDMNSCASVHELRTKTV